MEDVPKQEHDHACPETSSNGHGEQIFHGCGTSFLESFRDRAAYCIYAIRHCAKPHIANLKGVQHDRGQ